MVGAREVELSTAEVSEVGVLMPEVLGVDTLSSLDRTQVPFHKPGVDVSIGASTVLSGTERSIVFSTLRCLVRLVLQFVALLFMIRVRLAFTCGEY